MLATALERPGADDAQRLAEVEQALASRVRLLRFGDDLERRYQADTLEERRRFITVGGIGGILVYNLFLLSDWLTLNDLFAYVALGRLLLITPLLLGLLLVARRTSSRWTLDTLAAIGTVMASLMPLLVMIHSESPYRLHYQLGMLLLMVYCTMIQQLPFRHAAVAMITMLIIQLVTTYIADFADFLTWQANAVLFFATVALLLMASYFLEHGARLSYLFALRGRLLRVELREIARTDPLTQLFNRRYQEEVMSALWADAVKLPRHVAAILLDIDHFKAYNDSYGHPRGDVCLKQLSQTIQQTAQEAGALTFRFGGEEVLVLMVDADIGKARRLAEALRSAVAMLQVPHPVLGEGAYVTISLGLAVANTAQGSAEALISAADSALYVAKHAGRNCLYCAQPEAVNG